MPCRPATLLKRGSHHRITCVGRDVEGRALFFGLFRSEPDIINAVQTIGVYVTLEALHIMNIVRQHHHTALREHDVVVQVLTKPIP